MKVETTCFEGWFQGTMANGRRKRGRTDTETHVCMCVPTTLTRTHNCQNSTDIFTLLPCAFSAFAETQCFSPSVMTYRNLLFLYRPRNILKAMKTLRRPVSECLDAGVSDRYLGTCLQCHHGNTEYIQPLVRNLNSRGESLASD